MAGEKMLSMWDDAHIVDVKGEQDFATNVDHAIEEFLVSNLRSIISGAGFICEERGKIESNAEYKWIIDPLDGTRNFIKKMPIFNISLGLAKGEDLIFGMVYAPALNELFFAEKNHGAYLKRFQIHKNGEEVKESKISVSDVKSLPDAHIHIAFPNNRAHRENFSVKISDEVFKKAHRVRNIGCAALALCYTASGVYDAYSDYAGVAQLHDYAGGAVIIREAGGLVTDMQGNPYDINSRSLVASNALLHQQLLSSI